MKFDSEKLKAFHEELTGIHVINWELKSVEQKKNSTDYSKCFLNAAAKSANWKQLQEEC